MKIYVSKYFLKIFIFLLVKFSVYLNRLVLVMFDKSFFKPNIHMLFLFLISP